MRNVWEEISLYKRIFISSLCNFLERYQYFQKIAFLKSALFTSYSALFNPTDSLAGQADSLGGQKNDRTREKHEKMEVMFLVLR